MGRSSKQALFCNNFGFCDSTVNTKKNPENVNRFTILQSNLVDFVILKFTL